VNLLKVEPGSVSETCPMSSHDGNRIINIKVEEDPVSIEFPGIKAEHEVSCMSLCPLLHPFQRHPESYIFFLISVCQSVHMKHLHSTEWILKLHRNVSRGLYFD
jgi:hypothetical protein